MFIDCDVLVMTFEALLVWRGLVLILARRRSDEEGSNWERMDCTKACKRRFTCENVNNNRRDCSKCGFDGLIQAEEPHHLPHSVGKKIGFILSLHGFHVSMLRAIIANSKTVLDRRTV